MQMKNPLGVAPPRGFFILVSIQETVCVISTFIYAIPEKVKQSAKTLHLTQAHPNSFLVLCI